MKDIVKNRQRIPVGKKIQIAWLALRENGFIWSLFLGVYYASSAISDRAFRSMARRRHEKGLPGLNSAAMNKLIWESWDWEAAGEEWTPSAVWKESVIKCILKRHIKDGGDILEIGPGGGRWTEELQKRAAKLIGLDISDACVEFCKKRFADCDNVEFMVSSGRDLEAIADDSLDAVWSFDVFVHINQPELDSYAGEFLRVLRPGGIGVLHHGTVGGKSGGWRSDVTAEVMTDTLRKVGLEVRDQFKTWVDPDGTEYDAGLYEDAVTVFVKT